MQRSSRISARPSFRDLKGFTLIELLVVIAIIAILASILFPVFARARENARRSGCQSNLKQIGLGILQYSQDYDEKYPHMYIGGKNWMVLVQPYVKSNQLFDCPSDNVKYRPEVPGQESTVSYGYNTTLFERSVDVTYEPIVFSLASLNKPTETLMVSEGLVMRVQPEGYFNDPQPWNFIQPRHFEMANVLWADGHVKSMKKAALNVTAATEDGNTLVPGRSAFVYWNEF